MRLALGVTALCVLLWGCPDGGGNTGGGGGGGGGGSGQDAGQALGVTVVDATQTERLPLAMAVSADDRVGIAWFVKLGLSASRSVPPNDAGFDPGGASDYELRYAEWKAGTLSAIQKVTVVQRPFGLSLSFQQSGEPAVAYLGGGDDQSIYWFQSDAVVSYRSGGQTWTEQVVATTGDQTPCGDTTCAPVSDRGLLVGLNPALVFGPSGAHLAWRDGHDGQFPQQDWAGSDLESARGGPTTWTRQMVAAGGAGGSTTAKPGWGGHLQMVLAAGGQPAMVSDHVLGSADGFGQGVYLHRFNGTAWTTATVRTESQASNNQTGPSLAWAQGSGYGIAFVNRNTDALQFLSSTDGTSWTVPDVVFQNGTGGWYPSLAFDPANNQPNIAFYVCSLQTGFAEGTCPEAQDELKLTARLPAGTDWIEQVIDPEGGYLPKLAFLSNQKRVVAYRHPKSYEVKLFVQP